MISGWSGPFPRNQPRWVDGSVCFQRLLVCLEESIYIHNIKDMKLLKTILDIPPNPTGERPSPDQVPPNLVSGCSFCTSCVSTQIENPKQRLSFIAL